MNRAPDSTEAAHRTVGTTKASAEENATKTPAKEKQTSSRANGKAGGGFVVPIVHISIPETAVSVGFWGALGGAALLGAVELPLAALIGAGVIVARHHHAD